MFFRIVGIVVLLPFPFPQAPSQPNRGGRCSRDLTMGDSPAINHVWFDCQRVNLTMTCFIKWISTWWLVIFDNQHLTIRNLRMISIHLSSAQNPGWLMILGDYTTWYTGVIIIQELGIPITRYYQYFMEWQRDFEHCSFGDYQLPSGKLT